VGVGVGVSVCVGVAVGVGVGDVLLFDEPPLLPHPLRPGSPAIARVINTNSTIPVRDNRTSGARDPLALCEPHRRAIDPNITLPDKVESRIDSKCIMLLDNNQVSLVRPRTTVVITSTPWNQVVDIAREQVGRRVQRGILALQTAVGANQEKRKHVIYRAVGFAHAREIEG
jgi:hypothetical protein